MLRYIYLLLSILLIGSCVRPPEYPPEPIIEFVSMDKDIVTNTGDSVQIILKFTDGDGDLSFEEGYDESNLFVLDTLNNPHVIVGKLGEVELDSGQTIVTANVLIEDNRTGYLYNYIMPYIEPRNEDESISGLIYINFKTLTCRPFIPPNPTPLSIDTVSLTIQVFDRADHASNKVTTTPIYIQCR